MAPVRQDSTNSVRLRKVDEIYSRGLSFSSRSLTIGKDIFNSGTNSLVYGTSIRNFDLSNAIVSGVRINNSSQFNSSYRLRGVDVARSSYFGKSFTASFTDYTNDPLPASGDNNFNWFGEILYIGCVPVVPTSTTQNFFIGYGIMGLSHSWNATPSQTTGDVSVAKPVMRRGGLKIFVGPEGGNKWLGNPFDQGSSDQYMVAKLSLCDPFDELNGFADDQIGSTNSQTNENDISSLQDSNFKYVGHIPSENQDIYYNTIFGNLRSRNFDQGRVLNFRNSLVQGTNLNIDFYPSGLSNSIITGFRYPSLRQDTNIYDFWGDDHYSEFNAYNCSHLGHTTQAPSSYRIPEIISMTKTMGQVFMPGSISVAGYRNYPFCGRTPT